MEHLITIRYGEKNKMVLRMEKFFPRSKTWLNQFEKKVLRYCPDMDEVVDAMLAYLTGTAIPGLPEAARRLEGEIREAHLEVLKYKPRSWQRENAEWYERQLKSRQKRWPKYCAEFDMNKEVLESWRRV